MKIGSVATPFLPFGEVRYQKMKSFGFDAVDLNLSDTDSPFYTEDAIVWKEQQLLKAADIEVSQLHGPWRWPTEDSTQEARAERMDKMRRSIDIAAMMKCPYVVVHPLMPYGVHEKKNGQPDETEKINVEFMSRLTEYAQKMQVTLCLENLPFPLFSFGTPEETLHLIHTIDHQNCKMCLDTGHINFYHTPKLNIADQVRRAANEIRCLHVHDNHGLVDSHLMPRFGKIDWQAFVSALREINYQGIFSLETKVPRTLPLPLLEDACRLLAHIT